MEGWRDEDGWVTGERQRKNGMLGGGTHDALRNGGGGGGGEGGKKYGCKERNI